MAAITAIIPKDKPFHTSNNCVGTILDSVKLITKDRGIAKSNDTADAINFLDLNALNIAITPQR